MAGHDNDARADTLAHLITEQDVHAFIDGELPPRRRRAVEAFLASRSMTAQEAAAYLRTTLSLRAVRDELYRDDALRGEIERLMAKRTTRRGEDDVPARRVSA